MTDRKELADHIEINKRRIEGELFEVCLDRKQIDLITARLREPAHIGEQCGRYRKALEQIAVVCTAHMDRDCDHRLALDSVRQIANDELDAHTGGR